jgi:hypothetical protein
VKIAIQERAAGRRNLGLTAVLRGELEVFESSDGQELILPTPGSRDLLGDVAMLMVQRSYPALEGKRRRAKFCRYQQIGFGRRWPIPGWNVHSIKN